MLHSEVFSSLKITSHFLLTVFFSTIFHSSVSQIPLYVSYFMPVSLARINRHLIFFPYYFSFVFQILWFYTWIFHIDILLHSLLFLQRFSNRAIPCFACQKVTTKLNFKELKKRSKKSTIDINKPETIFYCYSFTSKENTEFVHEKMQKWNWKLHKYFLFSGRREFKEINQRKKRKKKKNAKLEALHSGKQNIPING